jgi:hypothetical protein
MPLVLPDGCVIGALCAIDHVPRAWAAIATSAACLPPVRERSASPITRFQRAVGSFETIIGPKPRARTLATRRGEAAIATGVLNRMIRAATPISIRLA